MLGGASRTKQVHHAMSMRYQPVRNMRTVTIRRIALRAHEADRVAAVRKRGRGLAEWRRLHMFLIRHAAVATERPTLPVVSDAGRLKGGSERLA